MKSNSFKLNQTNDKKIKTNPKFKQPVKEVIEIKDKSPLIYNRKNEKITKDLTKIEPNKYDEEIKPIYPPDNLNEMLLKENKELTQKNFQFINEILKLKELLKEKDVLILEKDKKILELENRLKNSHHKENIKETIIENPNNQAQGRLSQLNKIRSPNSKREVNIISNNPFNDIFGHQNTFQKMFERIHFLNHIIEPEDDYENQIIDEIYPNPDNMTYEELLQLQDKIGYESKGLKKDEILLLHKSKFSKSKFKVDKCTVCQFEFCDNDDCRKLNCGHIYHQECIDEWLLKDKKCPVCKIEVKI